jgi:hypothetical protein
MRRLPTVVELDNIMGDFVGTVVEPFTDIIGNWFWVILWTTIAGGVYLKSEGPALPTVILLLTIVFVAATLDVTAVYLYSILAALGIATIVYRIYRGRTS